MDKKILQSYLYPLHVSEKLRKSRKQLFVPPVPLPILPLIEYSNELQKLTVAPSNDIHCEEIACSLLDENKLIDALSLYQKAHDPCPLSFLKWAKSKNVSVTSQAQFLSQLSDMIAKKAIEYYSSKDGHSMEIFAKTLVELEKMYEGESIRPSHFVFQRIKNLLSIYNKVF